MKYFEFLNILALIGFVCVIVLAHAQITNIIDFKIIADEFIQLAKSL